MPFPGVQTTRKWLSCRWRSVIVFAPVSLANAQDIARIELSVSGIAEMKGNLAIAVFDSEPAFEDRANPVAQTRLPVSSESMTWSVDLRVPATYAIIVYQDLNGNGEIDMNRLGVPTEPYGFSNNARSAFGPPGFRKARITLESDGLSHVIEIR